ncbi:hypothetical protein, partial [Sphingomonas koreensis]|uniref:hypothetical protein n=1 Tax=Sphingomonas koreensis TaxID=93064 RepID=UPI0013DFCE43
PATSTNASSAALSPPSPSADTTANSPTRKAAPNSKAVYRPRLRQTNKDAAITEAAKKVGEGAEKVGDAAEKAGQRIENSVQ